MGEIKAPAGILGGAPSMFLCLVDIESALFMSHLCPRGSNEADSMYLRYKNQDSVFLKNRKTESRLLCRKYIESSSFEPWGYK